MSRTGAPVEVHASFRFTVEIDGIGHAAFTECSLPGLEVETDEVREGGLNEFTHKLPGRVKAGTVTLRHGITRGTALLGWYLQVMQGNVTDATRQVSVVMYDSALAPVVRWSFQNAYPVRWEGPTLKSDQQALAIEVLELTHHGFSVESG